MNKIYNFNFQYDKVDLLSRIERNKHLMDHIYTKAGSEKNNIGGSDCWRIELKEHLDNKDMQHIFNVCKPIIKAFNSINFQIKLQYYVKDNYIGWHYDAPRDSGITKVNLLLTENVMQKGFEDRNGNLYEFRDACIVNATTFEHRFVNYSEKPRSFIRIGLQDVLFSDAVNTLNKLNWNIDRS